MSGRERREERRFGPSRVTKRTGPTQRERQRREELKTIRTTSQPTTTPTIPPLREELAAVRSKDTQPVTIIRNAQNIIKQAESYTKSFGSTITWGENTYDLGTTQGWKNYKQAVRDAKAELKEYKKKVKKAEKEGKIKYTYSVTYYEGSTRKTKTFNSEAEAQKFADKINKQATEIAQHRQRERGFQGLTLQESAAVIRQERAEKGKTIQTTRTLGPGDTQRIEELIEKGQLTPAKTIEYSQRGKTTVGVTTTEKAAKPITIEKAKAKAGKIVSDSVTLLLASAEVKSKKLDPKLAPEKTWSRSRPPLTKEEREQVLIRADMLKDYVVAGTILGVAATLTPKTWTSLPKDAVKFARNPVAVTVATAATLNAAYKADPLMTSGLLLGSTIGSAAVFKGAGYVWRYGVKPPIGMVGGKVKTLVNPTIKKLGAVAKETYSTLGTKAAATFRNTPIDDAIQLNKLILEPNELYSRGPRLSLWDQYRQWKKLDFAYVPADPNIAVQSLRLAKGVKQEAAYIAAAGRMGVHNDFVEFLKIQSLYLKDRIQVGKTTGTFGEFLAAQKIKPLDAPVGILSQARIWYMLQQAKTAKNQAQIDAATSGLVFTKGKMTTPFSDYFKTLDSAASTKAEQAEALQKLKDYWRQFDPEGGTIRYPTPWEQEEAIKFFKELARTDSPLGMVDTEATALYTTLLKKGVSKAKATEAASNYATTLTIIAAMQTASPEDTRRYLQHLAESMNRLKALKLDKNTHFSVTTDIMNRIAIGIEDDSFKGLNPLLEKLDSITKSLEKTGELNEEKYKALLGELVKTLDITDITDIQDTTPIEIVEETPEQTVGEIQEIIEETLEETQKLNLSKADQEKRREMNLQFYMGPKQMWAIDYGFPRGPGRSTTVEARGMVDAMSKAQRATTPSRYLPNVVDIKLLKGK